MTELPPQLNEPLCIGRCRFKDEVCISCGYAIKEFVAVKRNHQVKNRKNNE